MGYIENIDLRGPKIDPGFQLIPFVKKVAMVCFDDHIYRGKSEIFVYHIPPPKSIQYLDNLPLLWSAPARLEEGKSDRWELSSG